MNLVFEQELLEGVQRADANHLAAIHKNAALPDHIRKLFNLSKYEFLDEVIKSKCDIIGIVTRRARVCFRCWKAG